MSLVRTELALASLRYRSMSKSKFPLPSHDTCSQFIAQLAIRFYVKVCRTSVRRFAIETLYSALFALYLPVTLRGIHPDVFDSSLPPRQSTHHKGRANDKITHDFESFLFDTAVKMVNFSSNSGHVL